MRRLPASLLLKEAGVAQAPVKAGKRSLGEIVGALPEFARQVRAETAKVIWPSRKETVTTAIMVVVMTVILGLFFFGVDTVFSGIVRELLKLLG